MKSPFLECGTVVNTHGVRGTMKLENLCDSPKVLTTLPRVFFHRGESYQEYKVLHASVQKQMVLMSLEGIDTVEAAQLFRGQTVYAAREDIPLRPGSYFLADILGLPVYDETGGQLYGHITDLECPAGQMIYVVRQENGSEFRIPAVKEFIRKVETEGEHPAVTVHLIEGMIDEI